MKNAARNAGAFLLPSRIARALCVLVALVAAPCVHAADPGLLQAQPGLVRMAAPPAEARLPAGSLDLELQTPDGAQVLRLRPHDALGALGSAGGATRAFTGSLIDRPGSWAAVTRIGTRWSGIWFDGAHFYGIEPAAAWPGAAQKASVAGADEPLVFRLSDLTFEEASFEGDMLEAPPGNGQQLALSIGELAPLAADLATGPRHRLELAMVADYRLAEREGEDLESSLLAQLNIIDGLFRNQLGVEVAADSVTLFTRRRNDPFSDTSEAGDLLSEVSLWRAGNSWQRQTALTHLFTGRDLNGRTVGLAYMDTLCSRRYSASLSEARGALTFAALVAAHEIAHVFGAPHDGDPAGACGATGQQYLMAPRISGSQTFSACSLAQMRPRIEAASCLVKLAAEPESPPPAPVNGASKGGGGHLGVPELGLLGALALWSARRRRLQMRANQSAR